MKNPSMAQLKLNWVDPFSARSETWRLLQSNLTSAWTPCESSNTSQCSWGREGVTSSYWSFSGGWQFGRSAVTLDIGEQAVISSLPPSQRLFDLEMKWPLTFDPWTLSTSVMLWLLRISSKSCFTSFMFLQLNTNTFALI